MGRPPPRRAHCPFLCSTSPLPMSSSGPASCRAWVRRGEMHLKGLKGMIAVAASACVLGCGHEGENLDGGAQDAAVGADAGAQDGGGAAAAFAVVQTILTSDQAGGAHQ